MRQIALIGMTGSGKSTVADLLSSSLNIPVISTGDLARQMAKEDEGTSMALNNGMMAPESAMRKLVESAVSQALSKHGGYIIEGFPRTTAQVIALLGWCDKPPEFYVLDTDPIECVKRLLARGRPDDTPDSIAKKIEFYETVTSQAIKLLGPKAVTVKLTVNQDPVTTILEREYDE